MSFPAEATLMPVPMFPAFPAVPTEPMSWFVHGEGKEVEGVAVAGAEWAPVPVTLEAETT